MKKTCARCGFDAAHSLGFARSDMVRDDAEHHALILFHAQEKRFDHFSCEESLRNMMKLLE